MLSTQKHSYGVRISLVFFADFAWPVRNCRESSLGHATIAKEAEAASVKVTIVVATTKGSRATTTSQANVIVSRHHIFISPLW